MDTVPRHVAIIMDGNGRWAEKRRRPRIFGHIHGAARVRSIVRECGRLGVAHLTLYAFSSENWGRPSDEVQTLMKLLCKYLVREKKTLMTENVRLTAIGELGQLPLVARKLLEETITLTAQNTGLNLNFALSYGSRQEILRAVRAAVHEALAADREANITGTESVSNVGRKWGEKDFEKYLFTAGMPDPDLIIRTSGEMRLSNFMLWQAAYSEIYVTPKFWPEFNVSDLHAAFSDFAGRKRRFGLTDKQIKSAKNTKSAKKREFVMTKIRVISALVAFVSVVVIVMYGGYAGIAISSFFICVRILYEYGRIILPGMYYKPARMYFILLGLVAFTVSILRNDLLLHSFVLSTLLLFVQFLFLAKNEDLPLEELVNKTGLCTLGILYAGVCPVYISLLAKLSANLEWFVFCLLVVFAGDTAAYFIGIKFGKTKLFPRISPGKSVEGAIASIFGSIIMGLVLRQILLPRTDLFYMFIISVLTSVVAQMGDLCESMIKRSFNVKDSGHIMPGHGGLLDRLDGVLFGAPVVYIFAKFLVLT